MKTVRKLAALLIALVVCLGFSVAAFGATITVENSDPGTDQDGTREEYTAYKIFDAVKAEGTASARTITSASASARNFFIF